MAYNPKKDLYKRFVNEQGGQVKGPKPRALIEEDEWVVSPFLITYNTNKQPTQRAFEDLQTLQGKMNTQLKFWKKVVKIAPKGRTYKTATHKTLLRTMAVEVGTNLEAELNKGFKISVPSNGLEVGTEKKRLHGHVFVKIRHRSRLHIDTEKFKAVCNKFLRNLNETKGRRESERVQIEYVNVKFIPHGTQAINNYVNKQGLQQVLDDNDIARLVNEPDFPEEQK